MTDQAKEILKEEVGKRIDNESTEATKLFYEVQSLKKKLEDTEQQFKEKNDLIDALREVWRKLDAPEFT